MKSYKELEAWKKGRVLVKKIYQITRKLPEDEKFGLISQMRKCAISVPANIAEGIGRNTKKDTTQFLHISRGSLYELETYVILCNDIEYIEHKVCEQLGEEINEVGKILNGLIAYFEK